MAEKNKTYAFHNILVLIAISLPLLAGLIKKNDAPDLVGIVISDEKPEFSAGSWFDGSYQAEMEDYRNDHWAFKEKTVRLNNQFYYKCFNQIRVNNFVSGKENYIFSEPYIYSAFGDDLLKESKVTDLLEKAKVVQDTLKKKGIDLLLVFTPGKGMMCREFVEEKYKHPFTSTNYDLFISNVKKYKNNSLDLGGYFEKLKTVSPYPLFTRFGHHWSYYAECLVVDTIIKHVEHMRNTDMPDIYWDSIDVIDSSRFRDADILKSMNLYANPAQNMKLAYPQIQFEDDSLKNRTRMLTISDSYWYGPVYMGVGQYCFGGGEFWYYYNRVVPSRAGNAEVWELDLKQEIESNQVIMLLYSDGNLPAYGNNFIYDAYELYTSPKTYYARNERNKQIQSYAKQIRASPLLLKRSTQKSKDFRITLDSAVRYDAMKMAGFLK